MSFLTKENGSGKARHGGKVWQVREELLQALDLKDGAVVSFHHHLRNGDGVMNLILQGLQKQGVKGLTLMASSIFPVHGVLRPLLQDGTITNIITSYISGPLGEAVSRGELQGQILMQSHGGRARSILSGEIVVDAAFIAAPSADPMGNISGVNGKNACGALGYAMADAQKAKTVIAVTDEVVPYPNFPADITQDLVDGILVVESIGEKAGIVSGTTKVTKDPIGLKIARDTLEVMEATGLLKEGFSYQSGAGGISLAVTSSLRDYMREKGLVGSFASGGITGHLTQMLEEGLFRALYDVQCFDLQAIDSLKKNPAHLRMSASQYGNPSVSSVVEKLDLVILGATEIDVDFNVNVTTGADGVLMGGSGGHQDTASGSQVSIIVSKLLSSRLPFIRERVDCITTPGSVVDVLVTERGIAVNPNRQDLLEKLTAAGLPVKSIYALKQEAEALMGVPKAIQKTGRVIGHSQSRTGEILDEIYQVEVE
ncbi:citrate lyase subunit alpha [Proteiniclasticum sp. BAD-10]|uniref:Citrate lyase alpha chain n=1 Tax=Proteiniclasticum sediminis TaxID=2804028 RepID=A0A941CQ97_9CLOT|nr:citrate lyase subunit alpha [Proteiniclasticum sediminis]MBR0576257.1 citrate lyase subunit alpha [Proteiniclasticum sediminis]